MLQTANTVFTEMSLTGAHILFDGELVAFRFTLSARHSGPLGDIPPSGKRITLEGMDMIRIVQGKMVELWSCQNALDMLRQMGCDVSMPPR